MSDVKDMVIKILSSREEIEKEAEKYANRKDVTPVLALPEDIRISKRNFSGVADEFNQRGYRQFSLKFSNPDIINPLVELGWPIQVKSYPDDPDSIIGYLTVSVNFDNEKKPPIIKTLTRRPDGKLKKNTIDKTTVGELDAADIADDNLKFKLSWYTNINRITGKPFVKSFLVTMHCTILPDEFDCDEDEIDAIEDMPEMDDLPFEAQ